MINKLYPIGTKVVIEKESNDVAVMIIGRILKINEDSFHDYAGVYYPVGYAGKKLVIKFQEEEIKRVIKIGYIDEEEQKITTEIKKALKG